MTVTLRDMFEQAVLKNPEKEGLYDVRLNKRWTFREWDHDVNRLANAFLSAGVKKGDRVSVFMFNTSEFVTALFACTKIGAIFNPINFRLMTKEVEFIIKDASPKVFLFEKAVEEQVMPLAKVFPSVSFWSIEKEVPEFASSYYKKLEQENDRRPSVFLSEDDTYALMYTSGTTGQPKGVVHRHRDMMDQSLVMLASLRLTPEDKGLTVAPLFHCAELHCAFFPRLHLGCTNILLHHFDPKKVLDVTEEEEITTMFAAPTMWNMLLQENLVNRTLSSLRQGLYGGAPMAPALVKKVAEQFKTDLIQAYGMTEMGPAITCLFEYEQLSKAGSAGKALINHDIRVVRTRENGPSEPDDILEPGELGEIIVKGPSMMVEYYNRPEATEEALYKGWYHSGDIGYLDKDGYLYVSDRVKDMIISGGENIYSREVEDALYEHPGVLDVAVIGEPDEKWGERVVALIVKKEESLQEDELDQFCKESNRLANYKRPRRYEFVNELPRNASGKLQKFKLREQVKQ
ncbi:fatty acid--CoA ligase [Bacillus sp. FJAT-44742]|uniref:fatty acid--CoA ligase n=1 Tax=Bacillus sp. FJAT-44742 TaxID=2014005 RepID=UPI000C2360A7|nr:fatty acid--CoA ligase [Bacillus sp. FJAT-44742]